MTITKYDPEIWLESAMRGLRDYTAEGFKESLVDDALNYSGDVIYEIIMEYPETDKILKLLPVAKTIIHFEIDDIDDRTLGFGDGVLRYNYDPLKGSIKPQDASEHRINLDVGIWTSDRAGGLTARLRAYQTLRNLFQGPLAVEKLRTATLGHDEDGEREGAVEILDFSGGRFYTDTISDITVYRLINCTLVIRVYSRSQRPVEIPTIEEILIIPELVIDDHLQLPMGVNPNDYGFGEDNAVKKPPEPVSDAATGSDVAIRS